MKNKNTVITLVILAVLFALIAIACLAYQWQINEVTAEGMIWRQLTYYGLPVSAVLAVGSAVAAIVLKRKK